MIRLNTPSNGQDTPITVGVDARLLDGQSGGIQQVVIGLAHGLSSLADGNERYLFLTHEGQDNWLRPYIDGPCQILPSRSRPKSRVKREVRRIIRTPRRWLERLKYPGNRGRVPMSDGLIEKSGIDLMHFTCQSAFLTEVPSIYHPHDLQHIHLPQYFSQRDREYRDTHYRAFCEQAKMVGVASTWIQHDLMKQYDLSDEKVRVVPWAPVLDAYPVPSSGDLRRVREERKLPEAFFFYPAQTWPHKNHESLFTAVEILRQKYDLDVSLVFSGRKNDHYEYLKTRAEKLNLDSKVNFLGHVSPLELQCLYQLCRALIIPTKFEAASFPLWEGFRAGAAAACSNVTSLPEQAGDAALLFSPTDPEEIASAMRKLWVDETLRETLKKRGYEQVAKYDWLRTARIFRAHYRRLTRGEQTPADEALMHASPTL